MLPPLALAPQEGADILDMAAAPGGKTAQMAAMTGNRANITACEINQIRAEKLKYNLEKQGATRVNIMVRDARKLEDFFGLIKFCWTRHAVAAARSCWTSQPAIARFPKSWCAIPPSRSWHC